MAQATVAPSRPHPPLVSAQVCGDLVIAWEAMRAASMYVQQLDQLVVHHDRWAHAYSSVDQLLEAGAARIATWSWINPSTGRGIAQGERVRLGALSRLELAAVRSFDWATAQAALYWTGETLLELADQLGVEL